MLREAASRLLSRAGLGPLLRLSPLPPGGNNRVCLLEHPAGKAVLKSYFRHASDPRDRLAAEFSFCAFAWDRGLRQPPRPLAKDESLGLALYEFIDGEALASADAEAVGQAAAFFGELNRHRGHPEARALPRASDGCFSEADHLSLVERRVAALRRVRGHGGAFVRERLLPAWRRFLADFGAASPRPLPAEQLCLSPSDFGFHNALRCGSMYRFLDFEYAGWDDPAKMAADFFSQVSVPVAQRHWEPFLSEAFSGLAAPQAAAARALRVLPVHRFKWICLMLGGLLPEVRLRRGFAGARPAPSVALGRAERALALLEKGKWLT